MDPATLFNDLPATQPTVAFHDLPDAAHGVSFADLPDLAQSSQEDQAQTNLANYLLTKPELAAKYPALSDAQLMVKRQEYQKAYDANRPALSSEKPLIPIPKPENTGVTSGIVRGAAKLVEGLETPATLMTIAAAALAPEAVAPIISAGFSADSISHLPEQAKAIINAKGAGAKAEAATEMAGNIAVAALAGAHAVKGAKTVVRSAMVEAAPLTTAAQDATRGHEEPIPNHSGPIETGTAPRRPADQPLGQTRVREGLSGQGHDASGNPETPLGQSESDSPAPATLAPQTTAAIEAAQPGKVTQLLERRQKTTDPAERQRLWDEAQDTVKAEGGTMKLGDEKGGVPLEVIEKTIARIPGAVPYAKGWVDRVGEFPKIVRGFQRMVKLRVERDKIPALYDAAENKAGLIANQARSSVRLASKGSELARKAATFVQQANGDREAMTAKLGAIYSKGHNEVIDYALQHWDELEPIAKAAREATDAAHAAANEAGIDLQYREGYVKGAYEEYDPHNKNVVFDDTKGGGTGSTSFRKSKVFNDYAEAIAEGFEPKTLDLADLTQSAVLNVMRKVNQRKWMEALGEIKLPNGEHLIKEPIKVEGRDSTGAVVHHGIQAPDGYTLVSMPEGPFAVQEDLAPLIKKLTDPSHFPALFAKISGAIKHNVLSYDIYHGSRFAQMQMAFEGKIKPSYRAGHALLEYAEKDLDSAVAQGEISPAQAKWARENQGVLQAGIEQGLNVGRISDALFKDISPLWPGAKATSKFIFDKLSRGIITESYIYAFRRNKLAFPDMPETELARGTAREVNTFYRNLGSQGFLKSKTWQDFARSVLLAPQWLEGRVRSEVAGYEDLLAAPKRGRVGNIGKGMATGLLAYFAANQIINLLTRGQPTWKNPEHGHKLDAFIPDVVSGSNGYFISPMSVFAETTHDVEKQDQFGTLALNIPLNLAKSQLSPAVQAAKVLATGEDFYSRSLPGMDRFLEAAKVAAPAPLVTKNQGRKGSLQQQAMSFAGIKSTPAGSFSGQTYGLARSWMRANGKPIRQASEPSIYGKLNSALLDDDTRRAKKEYDTLVKQVKAETVEKHFGSLSNVKFTGNSDDESEFMDSLDENQKAIYQKALEERATVTDRFNDLTK